MQSDSVSTALLSLSCRILWKLEIRIPFHAENGNPQRPHMDHPTPAYKVIWQRLFKQKNLEVWKRKHLRMHSWTIALAEEQ